MTKQEVIEEFIAHLNNMEDDELNGFYAEDGNGIWKYSFEKEDEDDDESWTFEQI